MRMTPRVAGFKSEDPAGLRLECMAGFVGIRKQVWHSCMTRDDISRRVAPGAIAKVMPNTAVAVVRNIMAKASA